MAFVLRAVDLRESDRIVQLFTEQFGRLSAVAPAARRSTKRFAGGLEPFQLIHVELEPGRGELARLREARVERGFPGILVSLERMREAGAALALVRSVAPLGHEEPELFTAVTGFLQRVDVGVASDADARWVAFARAVLDALGWSPRLDRCVACDRVPRELQAVLVAPTRGGVLCRACGGGSILVPPEVRRALSSELTELAPGSSLHGARQVLDAILLAHAGRTGWVGAAAPDG